MVLRGNAPEQIISFAKQDATGLTVSIIRHAPCPVLTVIRQPVDAAANVTEETMNAT